MTQTGSLARALVALPLAVVLAVVTLIAISLTSWGPSTTPFGELTRDRFELLIAAIAGSLAAVLVAWAFTTDKRLLVAAAVLGLTPAIIKTTAIFTGAY